MTPHNLWKHITTTRYTRGLEAEVTRLRAENRALLNSILGIAGVPPITLPDSVSVGSRHVLPGEESPGANNVSAASSAGAKAHGAVAVAPIRRRSWHQIYRLLEFDSAKKKPGAVDGTTMPRTL